MATGPRKHNAVKSEKAEILGHSKEVTRLRRICGQLGGIEKMIADERYCMEILQQVKAARSALLAVENSILKTHLSRCVRDAFNAKKEIDIQAKLREISDFLDR